MNSQLLDQSKIDRINTEHLIKTALEPADLIFVFGTKEGIPERIEHASKLWHAGFGRWMIVSGGMTMASAETECSIIKTGLVARGVPHDHIFEEHEATNTGENVTFSMPIIEAGIGLDRVTSIICVGNLWAGRRYAMTIHRHWPAPVKMLSLVNHFETPAESWYQDAELRVRVVREYEKIALYKKLGFIAEWP